MKYLSILFVICQSFSDLMAQNVINNSNVDTYKLTIQDTIIVSEKPYQSGDITMTKNQYKIMPASFQDPARILIKYPGFSTPNDGANAVVFRGFAPETARWQLFGADIVNPNHLSNAGTANDQAAATAGGVNALSGSVLDYYHFEANPADVSYSNVLSGVSNMKMAPKIRSFVDVNFIGLEAGFNLSNRNKKSTLMNNVYVSYRYSFVGLLNKLGVDFGNEKIGYQDLSGYVDVFKNDHNNLKVFFTIGNSSNIFKAVARGDSITRFKDIQNITFTSDLGIGGVQYTHENNKKVFQTTLATSFKKNERTEYTDSFYSDSLKLNLQNENKQGEHMLSSHSSYVINSEKTTLSLGLRLNHSTNSGIRLKDDNIEPIFSFYPYTKYSYKISRIFNYHFGLGAFYDSVTKEWTIEPAIGSEYKMSPSTSIELDYRLSSIQNYTSLQHVDWVHKPQRAKSHNAQISIQNKSDNSQIRASLFYHFIRDLNNFRIPANIVIEHYTTFNGGNLGYDQFSPTTLFNSVGTANARVYGGDLYYENRIKLWHNSLFYALNGSIFDSKYTLPNDPNIYYNAKYNYSYTANVFVSYDIDLSTDDKFRSLIIGFSSHSRGAQREQKIINEQLSLSSPIYDTTSSYDNKLRPYQRIDFRIVYKKVKKGSNFTQRWSLDIQNILNRENDGFRYYDALLKKVILQKQLGLIPVLSYKLEW